MARIFLAVIALIVLGFGTLLTTAGARSVWLRYAVFRHIDYLGLIMMVAGVELFFYSRSLFKWSASQD
jgi:hypothetical protein